MNRWMDIQYSVNDITNQNPDNMSGRFYETAHGAVALVNELCHGKTRLVMTEGPSTLVLKDTCLYVYAEGRSVPLATMRSSSSGHVIDVGLRYRDPLEAGSGRNQRIVGGWPGFAELLQSAVRRSRHWKNLETIEVSSEPVRSGYYYGVFSDATPLECRTYQVWATPASGWTRDGGIVTACNDCRQGLYDLCSYQACDSLRWASGTNLAVSFRRNRPVLVAEVTVEVLRTDGGHIHETVNSINCYPEFADALKGDDIHPDINPMQPHDKPDVTMPTIYVDMADEQTTRLPAHSEMRVSWYQAI